MFNQIGLLSLVVRTSSTSFARLGLRPTSASRRLFSSKPFIFNQFSKSGPKFHARVQPIALKASPASRLSKLGLFIGASTGVYLSTSAIQNDAAYISKNPPIGVYHNIPGNPDEIQRQKNQVKKNLSYEDLTYGSIFGLFLGIVIGKLSYVLAAISFTSFLSLQFLENRGIIHVPWDGIVNFGALRLNLKTLFFENPSFKLAFFLSFIIAAWNV